MKNESILTNVEERQNVFLKKVYLWMALGLAVTALAAFLTASSPFLVKYVTLNPIVTIICCVVEIVLLFFAYSAVTGVTFSSIILAYAGTNIITLSFVTAAVVFGSAALYGSMTKRSIKGWGGWLMMALISLIVVSVINMFLGSGMLEMIISGAGVVIFSLITAWDSQKLMDMNRNCGPYMTKEEMDKISILGALDLYLDFVNIFLYLLRLFANAKNNN